MHLLERLVLGLFRVRRYVAPAVLVLSFAVTQVLFRMPEEGLEAGRWLLAPHVVLAAALLWPLALGRRGPAPVRLGTVTALSAATVLVTLFAIPLWAGHGCWAPDLYCFALFLLAGLALALVVAPLGARRLGSLEGRRVGGILALFLVTFSLGVGVTLARAQQARPPAAAGPRPEVLWSRTPWEGLWAYLAPRPWVDAGYAPADPAVDGEVVVFVGTPEQVDILNCRDGTTLWSATVEPPVRPLRSDTARNVWTRPVVSGGYILLQPRAGRVADPRLGVREGPPCRARRARGRGSPGRGRGILRAHPGSALPVGWGRRGGMVIQAAGAGCSRGGDGKILGERVFAARASTPSCEHVRWAGGHES